MARARHERHSAVPDWTAPMLAKPDGGHLRSGPQWAYEHKLDGYRAAMRIAPDGTTVLTSRNGIDFTAEFASLAGVLPPALDGRAAVLDGEIVAYNPHRQVDFGLLQERRGRYRTHTTGRRRSEPFDDVPVRYLAFDLLQLGNESLLTRPYDQRRALLEQIPMPDPYLVSVVPAFTFEQLAADRLTPQDLLDQVAAAGLEGLVAKQRLRRPPARRPAPDERRVQRSAVGGARRAGLAEHPPIDPATHQACQRRSRAPLLLVGDSGRR